MSNVPRLSYPLAGAIAASTVSIGSPAQGEEHLAGSIDGYALPGDETNPSPHLVALLDDEFTQSPRDCDVSVNDDYVGHTFTDQPCDIVAATLTLRLRPSSGHPGTDWFWSTVARPRGTGEGGHSHGTTLDSIRPRRTMQPHRTAGACPGGSPA